MKRRMSTRGKRFIAIVLTIAITCCYMTLVNIRFTNLEKAEDLVKVADR